MEVMTGDAAGPPVAGLPRAGLRLFGDDRLVRLAAAGDMRALAAIYRRHHQELYRYCRAILRDPDEAEDALQATMAKAVSALPGETRDIALKPWLYRVAHNEAINIMRARRPWAALDTGQPALGAEVERRAEDRDRLRRLVRDLDRLPERQRGALVMRELSGLSFEEIGGALALGPDAAKQAVYEARVSLQEMAAGRDMDCEAVRQAISAGDRRTLRSRRLRAHLRDCERCSDFAVAIDNRRVDLAALAPPIAMPAALAALHAALGGGSAGAGSGTAAAGAAGGASVGSLGAGLGGAVGGTAAVKTAAAVIAATAIAGGAAGVTGVVHLGGSGHPAADHGATSNAPAPVESQRHAPRPTAAASAKVAAGSSGTRTNHASSHPNSQRGEAGSAAHGHHHGQTPSGPQGAQADEPPASSQAPATPPGQAQSAPGEASSSVADGASQTHGKPSTTPQSVGHSNPQAQLHSNSAAHSQAGAASGGGGSAAAPGQAAATGHGHKPQPVVPAPDE
jgi:RNA polymerase sigma factor (sigma-70 family)